MNPAGGFARVKSHDTERLALEIWVEGCFFFFFFCAWALKRLFSSALQTKCSLCFEAENDTNLNKVKGRECFPKEIFKTTFQKIPRVKVSTGKSVSCIAPFPASRRVIHLPALHFSAITASRLPLAPLLQTARRWENSAFCFFMAAVVQSKRPAACIHFPLACSCNYLNVWTVDEMSDDTPRCECFTPVLCCSCAGQTQQSPSVGLESVFLSSSSHWY